MPMRYQITTTIESETITVQCNEQTARKLLSLWAYREPNRTTCYDTKEKVYVVCF